jgi:hypothetical protein
MEQTYRPNWYPRFLGPVCLVISALLVVVLITGWEIDEPNEEYPVIGMLVFFFLGGIYVTLETLFFKVIVSHTAVSTSNIIRADKRLAWTEIEKVDISLSSGIITVHGKKEKIQFTKTMKHAEKLVETITCQNWKRQGLQYEMKHANGTCCIYSSIDI